MIRLDSDDTNAYVGRATRYHYSRMLGNAKTKSVGEAFGVLHDKFAAATSALNEALFKATVLTGELAFADAAFDGAVGSLNRSVLEAANGDRDAAVYREFFPTGRIEETVSAPAESDAASAARIQAAAAAYPSAVSAEKVQAVVAAAKGVGAAIAAVVEHSALVGKLRGDVVVARIPLVRAHNEDHPRLVLLLSGATDAQIESFFYREKKRGKSGGSEPEA